MRIGLGVDELVAGACGHGPARYVGAARGLRLVEGETVALVGRDTRAVVDGLAEVAASAAVVDGATAARGGVLRVHAVQAARVGVTTLLVTGPVDAEPGDGTALAVADLAACAALGLSAVVEVADVDLAAQFADRVAVVADGHVVTAYPVLASRPRRPDDVAGVVARVRARLA